MNIVRSIHDVQPQLANSRDFYFEYGECERSDDPEFMLYRSDVQQPRRNGVLKYGHGAGELESAVAQARQRLSGQPWLWWAGADSSAGLADQLLALGAVPVGTLPVMAAEIDRVEDTGIPNGLVIEEVAGSESLLEWVRAYAPSFGIDPANVSKNLRNEANRRDTPGSLVRFSGRIDGEIVGTSALFDRHGVAGVYVVTTARGYRGRGIGAALTTAALRSGYERGLEVATLQASSDGERLYRRMGFQRVGQYEQFSLS
jgi:ribosomal protein S18 acetylase RimI-like enzyme